MCSHRQLLFDMLYFLFMIEKSYKIHKTLGTYGKLTMTIT